MKNKSSIGVYKLNPGKSRHGSFVFLGCIKELVC